jgi:predicted tellurium resistance membrane protein TerC
MTLVAEGLGQHIAKGYIYFAMAFSVFVEILNLRLRKKSEPVHLNQQLYNEDIMPGPSREGGR